MATNRRWSVNWRSALFHRVQQSRPQGLRLTVEREPIKRDEAQLQPPRVLHGPSATGRPEGSAVRKDTRPAAPHPPFPAAHDQDQSALNLSRSAPHPLHQDIDDINLLLFRERPTRRDTVPLRQAGPAAGRRGMLRNEDGMAAHRRLPAFISGLGRGEPLSDKIGRMRPDHVCRLGIQVCLLLLAETETGPKGGSREAVKDQARIPRHHSSPRTQAAARSATRRRCASWVSPLTRLRGFRSWSPSSSQKSSILSESA